MCWCVERDNSVCCDVMCWCVQRDNSVLWCNVAGTFRRSGMHAGAAVLVRGSLIRTV